jgi:membrane protease YdiL (CAAX protease family)
LPRALLFSSWLVIIALPIVARRPSAYGWRLGDIRRHIPLIVTTLAVAAVVTYAIIRAVGATPYRDASLVVEAGVVPVTEELAFRSLLLTTLVAVLSRIGNPARAVTLAVVIDGVAFGVGHLANATSLPLAFVVGQAIFASCLGVACAWLMVRTRSVYPAIALHAVVNAVVVLA